MITSIQFLFPRTIYRISGMLQEQTLTWLKISHMDTCLTWPNVHWLMTAYQATEDPQSECANVHWLMKAYLATEDPQSECANVHWLMKPYLTIEDEPETEAIGLPREPGENRGLHSGDPASDLAWSGTRTQKKNTLTSGSLGYQLPRPTWQNQTIKVTRKFRATIKACSTRRINLHPHTTGKSWFNKILLLFHVCFLANK